MRSHRILPPLLALCALFSSAARAGGPEARELPFSVEGRPSSALLLRPAAPRALLVLGHGASESMRSPFPTSLAEALARQGVATLRFNFPYAEAGGSQPDPPRVLQATVRAAIAEGERHRGALPMLVAGKSLSTLVVATVLGRAPPSVAGGVMLAFPLHAPGRPSARNAKRLEPVEVPLLFVQGTRDALADPSLMRALVEKLGPHAQLRLVHDADHQFELPSERSGARTPVADEIAGAIAGFAATLEPPAGGS